MNVNVIVGGVSDLALVKDGRNFYGHDLNVSLRVSLYHFEVNSIGGGGTLSGGRFVLARLDIDISDHRLHGRSGVGIDVLVIEDSDADWSTRTLTSNVRGIHPLGASLLRQIRLV